jgi:hypothetical protein
LLHKQLGPRKDYREDPKTGSNKSIIEHAVRVLETYDMMKTIWRERLAQPDVVFNRLGGGCRFDEAEKVLYKGTHRVFDLTPERRLGADHLYRCVNQQPSTPDDRRLTIWIDSGLGGSIGSSGKSSAQERSQTGWDQYSTTPRVWNGPSTIEYA